jgi:acyl carrier protein
MIFSSMSQTNTTSPTNTSIESEIRNYINRNMLFDSGAANFTDDASLLQEGIIDSIGIMELVTFITQTYGVSVQPEEILPENFDSISRISNFVRRRQAA